MAHQPASWLTPKRIRMHGLLLALSLWAVYTVDMSTPTLLDRNGLIKGTDFMQFYTLGYLGLHHRGDLLYNPDEQSRIRQRLIPEAQKIYYAPVYGPQVSLLFAPLAELPYGSALPVWLLLNLVIYGASCYGIWRTCANLRDYPVSVAILAVAFPGFVHLVTFGQSSGLALLCFSLAYLALRKNHIFAAGLAWGSLALKPQLGLAVAVVLLINHEWNAIFGAITAAAAQLALGCQHYGAAVLQSYFHVLLHINKLSCLLDPYLYHTFSLYGFWSLLIPNPRIAVVMYAITASATLGLTAICWRSNYPLELRYSALLFASALAAPHCNEYDLVILAPALLLLADRMLQSPGVSNRDIADMSLLLYTCYPLFLLQKAAAITRIQWGVIAMALILWKTTHMSESRSSVPRESQY